MSLLGIHVGAEGVTAGVFDIEGCVLGRGSAAYRAESPEAGVSEVWMDAVWDVLKTAVGQALSGTSETVTAMSLAVRGDASVSIDREGRPLGPSILPDDAQADAAAREFHERFSPIEVMRLTGMPPVSTSRLVRLLWLKTARPDVYDATWKFMGWHEYLANRLGLGPVTDPSLAGRTQMFDIVNRVWAEPLIDAAGIDRGRLPDVRPAGTALGDISRRAAEELGLPAHVRFVVGGYDAAVSALGVGAVAGGHVLNATDGVEWFVPALHEPAVDPGMLKNGFACTPHVVPGMFVSIARNPTGGGVIAWLAGLLGLAPDSAKAEPDAAPGGERRMLETLLALMDREPTKLFVLPYFGPSGTPYDDARASGSIVGLDLSTTRGTLARAAVEGLALEMKLNATLLGESLIRLNEVNVTGAPARSREWCQIKADVLGLPVRRHPGIDAAALGAAMLAGIGTGVYENTVGAVEFCVNPEDVLHPNGDRTDFYAKKFEGYRRLYPALRDIVR